MIAAGVGAFRSYMIECCVPLRLQLHTDMDHGDSAVKYTLSGEGAGSIFTIDHITGDIHALVGLDRSVLINNYNNIVIRCNAELQVKKIITCI